MTAPSGEIWEWHDPSKSNFIEGSAVDFCRVVTQTRNIAPRDFYKPFMRALCKAEVKGFGFHDLRHTAGSYLAIAGVSERYIAEILGHKTLEMVKRYTHLKPEHLRDAVALLGNKGKSGELKHIGDSTLIPRLKKEH